MTGGLRGGDSYWESALWPGDISPLERSVSVTQVGGGRGRRPERARGCPLPASCRQGLR